MAKKKIENMNVEELKKLALKYGVTFSKGTKKDEMMKFLKHHEEGLKLMKDYKSPISSGSSPTSPEETMEPSYPKILEEPLGSSNQNTYTLVISIPASDSYSLENLIDQQWWIDNFFHKYYKEEEMPEYILIENIVQEDDMYTLTITLIYGDNYSQEEVQGYMDKYKDML